MRSLWVVCVASVALSSCLIAVRDNTCDPESAEYDVVTCRTSCKPTCGANEGSVVSESEGCQCLPCDQITCGAGEYRVACGCLPLNGTLDCSGGNCNLTCNNGFDSCNSDPMDGCEAELARDANNCSMCGRSCDGVACENGRCAPKLWKTGLNYEDALADDRFLYYADGGSYGGENDGSIRALAIDSGSDVTLYSNGSDEMRSLARDDGSRLYWCKSDFPSEIRYAERDRAGTTLFRNLGSNFSIYCNQLRARGGSVYAWVWDGPGDARYELHKYTGAGEQQLGTAPGTGAGPLAENATYLFFVNDDVEIKKVPFAGGAVSSVVAASPDAMRADEEKVYWLKDKEVYAAPVEGGAAQLLTSHAKDPTNSLYVDATHIYWIVQGGVLLRAPKAGGAAEELTTIDHAATVTGNATTVFISSSEGGDFADDVYRMTK